MTDQSASTSPYRTCSEQHSPLLTAVANLNSCVICHGAGVLNECRSAGRCSHVDDREWPCPECEGDGEVPADHLYTLNPKDFR